MIIDVLSSASRNAGGLFFSVRWLSLALAEQNVSLRIISHVDAFTTVPFAGNPCAVLPDATGLSDEQMQAIAREANLPESSFVLPSEKADFRVRYFTPRMELPFAGHPTIATAFLLTQAGRIPLREPVTTIQLEFEIGVLPVDIHVQDGRPVHVVMTQKAPTFGPTFTTSETAPCFVSESCWRI